MANLRLFVALELEPEARRALVAWQRAEVEALAGLRVMPARALHLTLRFLGDQPHSALPELAAALSVGFGSGACPLVLGDPIWLPAGRPRVLAARVRDADGRLGDLVRRMEEGLRSAVARTPDADFLPHVTVARVPRGERVAPTALPGPEPVAFSGRRILLLRSLLGEGPPRYEELYAISL